MITKEEFTKFISNHQIFDRGIERFEKAITGKNYTCNLIETDWGEAVGYMLDSFLESHFTEKGCDWIYYYLFEDVEDHKVIVKKEADMFNVEEEIEYHLNSIDELWKFLLTDKKLYFKNAE